MDPERALWTGPPPPPRRPRPLYATPRLAALLATVLIILLGVAVLLPPSGIVAGLNGFDPFGLGPAGPPGPNASLAIASIGPSPSPTHVRPTPPPLPSFVAYRVRRGDTLTAIARRYQTTARSIAFWNRATYPTLDPDSPKYRPGYIEVGWTLVLIPRAVVDEDELPSASPPNPTPSAPPAPTPTPTLGPISTDPAIVVSHGPRGTNQVALTFDMGGRLDPAVDIMTVLAARGVHATIFPTGELATTRFGRDALAIVRDRPDLFVLANHSWDHPDFTTLTEAQIASQLDRTEKALSGLVGRTSRPFFRPPYGAWNHDVRVAVGRAGWHYMVMWDIDTIDWKPTSQGGPTAEDIEARVLANAEGGSIVLMHLGGYHTLEALPAILDGLAGKGLQPVTLREMLGG
jgi:peptidoglycan/xylan/chitin deacetylase (PgdA/CDA1 family)